MANFKYLAHSVLQKYPLMIFSPLTLPLDIAYVRADTILINFPPLLFKSIRYFRRLPLTKTNKQINVTTFYY